jgi:hypothetical protein
VISKSVLNKDRLEQQRKFITSDRGRAFWMRDAQGRLRPSEQAFKLMHTPPPEAKSGS